jgi:hypothetical protein
MRFFWGSLVMLALGAHAVPTLGKTNGFIRLKMEM